MALPYVAGVVAGKLLDHVFSKRRSKAEFSAGGGPSFSDALGSVSGSGSTAEMDQMLAKQQEILSQNLQFTMVSTLEKGRYDLQKSIIQNMRTS